MISHVENTINFILFIIKIAKAVTENNNSWFIDFVTKIIMSELNTTGRNLTSTRKTKTQINYALKSNCIVLSSER